MKIIYKKWLENRAFFLILPLLFLILMYFLPMLSVLKSALNFVILIPRNFLEFIQRIWKPLSFTFYQALVSTFFTLLIGLPASFFFANYEFKGKRILNIFATLPFLLPTVVVAACFNTLIGPNGWINLLLMQIFNLKNAPLQILNSLFAIVIAHVFYNTSIILRIVSAAWERLDYRLEQSAKLLGASSLKTFIHITFPLLKPAIISSILLVFLFDFTSFGVVMLLGGPQHATLEVEIYLQTLQLLNISYASFLSLFQLAITMVFSFISLKYGQGTIVPFIPRLKIERLKKPKKWRDLFFLGLVVIVLVVIFVLPIISLLIRSIVVTGVPSLDEVKISAHLSLKYFQELFINRRQSLFYVPPITAIRNSIIVAIITSVLALFLGLIIALIQNSIKNANQIINIITMLPLGTSAVTLGLGYIIAFSSIQNVLSFPILIPFAHALVALPFVIRILYPAIRSVPNSFRQSAKILGANNLSVIKEIELPIIFGPLLVASIFAFSISLGEFGATAFLTRPEFPTIPIAIFRYINLPGPLNYGQSLAMAVILLLTCTVSILLMNIVLQKAFIREKEMN